MMALIFDDAEILQGNVIVADQAEFDEFIGQLPDDWYGELRAGFNGRKLHNHYAGLYIQAKCIECGDMIIEQRMKTHMHRKHHIARSDR